jgi:hypothetical protein
MVSVYGFAGPGGELGPSVDGSIQFWAFGWTKVSSPNGLGKKIEALTGFSSTFRPPSGKFPDIRGW